MTRYLQFVAWTIGIGFVLWAVLFGSFWMVRNGCAGNLSAPHCNGGAAIEWLGNVVLLGWVKNYQTLVAGILALTAGAFVLVTAVYQEEVRSRDRRHAEMTRARGAMALVRSAFHEAIMAYAFRKPDIAPPVRDRIVAACTDIAAVDPGLAETLLLLAKFSDNGLAEFRDVLKIAPGLTVHAGGVMVREGYIDAQAAADFLTDTVRLFTSEYRYNHQKLPAQRLTDVLKPLGLKLENPVLVSSLYDLV